MEYKYIHFVGIRGIAMASLASYCVGRGIKVTGSDTNEEFPSDEVLKKIGLRPISGFDSAHIEKPDLVIYTGAHGGRLNVEVQTAINKGITVLPHGKALGMFMEGKRQISVAGCHGKTTTTAMIATVLMHAGLDPSYAIGSGMVAGLGLPGHAGKGEYFIAEADEYVTEPGIDSTPRFLWQNPEILVITNVDFDHPDVYNSLREVKHAYQKFVNKVPLSGLLVLSAGDLNSNELKYAGMIIKAQNRLDFSLTVPGDHNENNAALVVAVSRHIGVSDITIQDALKSFSGAKRRFEKIGEVKGKIIFDDYAHHPREIEVTIAAARKSYPDKRILVIFQPHTYSRTKIFLKEFSDSFSGANIVVLTDIYASAREVKSEENIISALATLMKKKVKSFQFRKDYSEVLEYLMKSKNDFDIIITMGAGDIYTWGRRLVYDLG